jgi:hypothetical protein
VTVLEEMPVQETTDGIRELRAIGLPVGGVVVNLLRPRDLADADLVKARRGKLDLARVAADLEGANLEATPELVEALVTEARDHAERRALEDDQRGVVDELGVPTYELPRLAAGVDLGGLYELAELLKEQGLA